MPRQAEPETPSLKWVHRIREQHYRKTKRLPLEPWLRPIGAEKAAHSPRDLGLTELFHKASPSSRRVMYPWKGNMFTLDGRFNRLFQITRIRRRAMDMSRRFRPSLLLWAAGLLLMYLGLPPAASAQNTTVLVPGQGEVFCPSRTLVLGTVALPPGDCFKLAVFRDASGTYLAFLPPTAPIAPGQVVSVGPAAAPNPSRPLLLIPITAPTNVAVNTMMLVPARIEATGPQTRIVAMGGPLTNTIVLNRAVPVSNAVTENERSEVFCPSAALVSGNVVIPAGDCYRLAVLQNSSGTFLAFIPQAIALPAGQLISLSAPVLNGAGMYLVPITTAATIPLDTLEVVPATISTSGTQEVITLTGGPAVNTVVILNMR